MEKRKTKLITIRCKGCMRTLCRTEKKSEIVKTYKCPWCGRENHYDGTGILESVKDIGEVATASGKRFL